MRSLGYRWFFSAADDLVYFAHFAYMICLRLKPPFIAKVRNEAYYHYPSIIERDPVPCFP
jgi:hypothetical protein